MTISIDINNNKVSGPKPKKPGRFSFPKIFKRKKEDQAEKLPLTDEEKKKRKRKKIILSIVALLLVVGGYYAFRAYQFADTIGLKIKAQDILNLNIDPELKRDSSESYTGFLIVGIDTRNSNSGLKNTDTVMVARYDHKSGETVMMSIPRDFFVEVPNEGWYTKINGVYARGETIEEGSGLDYLQSTVEEITGIEIQYYGMIDLQGFVSVIDAVGGITVNVENTFTDQCYPADASSTITYPCGNLDGGLGTPITFEKGPQVMDGARALQFARSRHGNNGEGSDFARARRQQKVIVAIKDKLLSSETLLNPQKILEIFSAVQGNLRLSDFTTEDIQAGINIATDQRENPAGVYSFVLDPAIGNYSVVTSQIDAGNAYAIGPKLGLGNYTDVHKILNMILEYPGIYSEDAVIRVYDVGLGYQETYDKTLELQEMLPFTNIRFMGTYLAGKTGTVVYDHTENLNSKSVAQLAELLETEDTVQPDYITTNLNGEEITILFGAEIAADLDENNGG